MSEEEQRTFLPSRTGASFGAIIEIEDDGVLTILSNDGHGVRSAHRDYAANHFEHKLLWCKNRLSWINSEGVRVSLTSWHTEEWRKSWWTPIAL